MIKEAIAKLVDNNAVNYDEAYNTMTEIMGGETTPAQIAAYITALRMSGETPEAIAGSAAAMREKFTAVTADSDILVDTCGTGWRRSANIQYINHSRTGDRWRRHHRGQAWQQECIQQMRQCRCISGIRCQHRHRFRNNDHLSEHRRHCVSFRTKIASSHEICHRPAT